MRFKPLLGLLFGTQVCVFLRPLVAPPCHDAPARASSSVMRPLITPSDLIPPSAESQQLLYTPSESVEAVHEIRIRPAKEL